MISQHLSLEELVTKCSIILTSEGDEYLLCFPFAVFQEHISNLDCTKFEISLKLDSTVDFYPIQRNSITVIPSFLKDKSVFTFIIRKIATSDNKNSTNDLNQPVNIESIWKLVTVSYKCIED